MSGLPILGFSFVSVRLIVLEMGYGCFVLLKRRLIVSTLFLEVGRGIFVLLEVTGPKNTPIDFRECSAICTTVFEVLSILETNLSVNGRLLTFEDIEGRKFICKGRTRPYKRCLNFHASRACSTH
jgi:hypothetical protein